MARTSTPDSFNLIARFGDRQRNAGGAGGADELLGQDGQPERWLPEAGGRADFASEHDEQAMTVLGLSSMGFDADLVAASLPRRAGG